jgi:uncharacterized protein (DUF1697 family)
MESAALPAAELFVIVSNIAFTLEEICPMKYIALLRGINVGGNLKVEMKKLKIYFESIGCTNVSTYINSGNVFFESDETREHLRKKVEAGFENEFGFDIPLLIKTKQEIKKIADAIPQAWQNDAEQRTDVAYLFEEIDSKEIVDLLPIKKELVEIKYIKGAVFWNVKRADVMKSRLAKIISHTLYKSMTVRNVNTARYLAETDR